MIDTSSLIYLSKINLLYKAVHSLNLMTVPGVFKEFGSQSELKHIKLIDINDVSGFKEDTDRHLIETAKIVRVPVISEDKKVLMQAKRFGFSFFNTLMIMNFLLYKKSINQAEYKTALDQLWAEAYYGKVVFDYGKKVYEKIMETKKINNSIY